MSFPLINLTDWPTMPAPMQSKDPGEAWVWGDFFAVLQKEPKVVAQAFQAMAGKTLTKAPMDYPYAMTVFYNKAKNPHGPSSRSVLCVALEEPDPDAFAALFGGGSTARASGVSASLPMMIGVFTGSGRQNLGEYNGPLTPDAVRSHFFEIIRNQLNLQGEPTKIGPIDAIYGHPDTGWDASPKTAKRSCLIAISLFIGMILLIVW